MALSRSELARAIKKARNSKGMTQDKLAEAVGISSPHIKQVESGRRRPSNDLLFRISLALDLSLDSLLTKKDDSLQELRGKINVSLGQCSVDELEVTYATLGALQLNREKKKELEKENDKELEKALKKENDKELKKALEMENDK